MKIAVIEDEKMTRTYIKDLLKNQGYEVDLFRSGEAAIDSIKENFYKIIVLDLNLPLMTGYDVCYLIKKDPEKYGNPKVLILSERKDQGDVNKGLKIGADEYIRKPFDETEFILRINNLIETTTNLKMDRIEYKGLIIDFGQSYVVEEERKIKLTNKEKDILHFFVLNIGLILSKEKIYRNVWGENLMPGNKSVEVYLVKLKKKIKTLRDNIENFRDLGYKLKD